MQQEMYNIQYTYKLIRTVEYVNRKQKTIFDPFTVNPHLKNH